MSHEQQTKETDRPLDRRLEANTEAVRSAMGDSQDLIVKSFTGTNGWRMALLYVEGLADKTFIHDSILAPLIQSGHKYGMPEREDKRNKLLLELEDELTAGDVCPVARMDALLLCLLSGEAILLLDECDEGLRIGAAGWEDRAVGEPTSQAAVRGPMEAFTENIRTNTALIRRRIKDPRLWLETRQIGTVTHTNVSIMYLKHLADVNVVNEVRRRLDRITVRSSSLRG